MLIREKIVSIDDNKDLYYNTTIIHQVLQKLLINDKKF